VIEVKEILRLWLEGRSLREITTLAGWTARRCAVTYRLPRPRVWFGRVAWTS
jgi:hypothetical protein